MNMHMSDRWYNRSWLSIALSLLIFPFGLYALWKNQRLGKTWKIVCSILSPFTTTLALLLGILGGLELREILFKDEVLFGRASIRYVNKDFKGAIAGYDSAIMVNPSYSKAYMMRGISYENLGDTLKAIVNYTLTIQFDSTYSEAYLRRGVIKIYQKKYWEALTDFNATVKYDSTDAEAYLNRSIAKYNLAGYTLDEAIGDLSKAIKLKPTEPLAYFNRGLFRLDNRIPKEALTDFDQAIRLSSNPSGDLFYFRGLAKIRLYQKEEACKDFNLALKKGEPRATEALENYCP